MTNQKKALSYLLKGAFFSCCNLLVNILFGLLLTPYMLSVLGEREYGIWIFAGLFTGWCGLVDFGLTTACSRFVTVYYSNEDSKGIQETGNTALVLFSFLGLIVLLLSILTAGLMKIFGGTVPDIDLFCLTLLITGGGFAVSKLVDGVCGIINGTMRQELSGSRQLVFRFLYYLLAFVVLACGGRVITLALGNFLLMVLQFFVLARLVRVACPSFRFSIASCRRKRICELFGYSVFTFITQVGEMLIQRTDLLLIMLLLSVEEMTRYNLVVIVFMSYYSSFMGALTYWQTNWFTHLHSRADTETFLRSQRIFYKLAIYLTFFMSFGLIVWGRAFIARWIGPEYLTVFPCLLWSAVAVGLYRGPAEINLRLLQGIARHDIQAWLVLVQGVVTILVSLTLLKSGWGLFGVVIGTIVPAIIVHHVVVPGMLAQLQHSSLVRYYWRLVQSQFPALIALVAPWFITRFLLPIELSEKGCSYFWLMFVGLLSLCAYLIVLWMIGFSKSEKDLLKRFIREKIS